MVVGIGGDDEIVGANVEEVVGGPDVVVVGTAVDVHPTITRQRAATRGFTLLQTPRGGVWFRLSDPLPDEVEVLAPGGAFVIGSVGLADHPVPFDPGEDLLVEIGIPPGHLPRLAVESQIEDALHSPLVAVEDHEPIVGVES